MTCLPMSWEREFIARHPGWIQVQDLGPKLPLPLQSKMNVLLFVSLSACVCVQKICREPKQKVAMRTCPFACLLPLAATTASFKNGKTASPLSVTRCGLSHLGKRPAYDVALKADRIFGINTLTEAWTLAFGVGTVFAFPDAAWCTRRTWTRFELGSLQINLSL